MSSVAHTDLMVDVRDLQVTFTGASKPVHAVQGVNLQLRRGEVIALIGESGSGKSVTLRSLLRLHPSHRTHMQGHIQVAQQDVMAMNAKQLSSYRGRVASMIFQEPLLALDPVYSVGQQITETIRRHEALSLAQAQARALELFERVRIPSAQRRLAAYPHEMSGGMRQRAMIALALACRPQVLLADEPTTALDATVQIQILLLLRELQRDLGLSVIFVTHDIGAAVEVADRMAVMYAGRIVEEGLCTELIHRPRHPYTRALLASRAHAHLSRTERLATIAGAPPDLSTPLTGCAFAPRCAHAVQGCRVRPPEVLRCSDTQWARCDQPI